MRTPDASPAASSRRPSSVAALTLALAAALGAQQQNSSSAALSVNGTGKVDPTSGSVLPSNSAATPAPPGGAPLYWHRAQARSALELRIQGVPNMPVILVAGTPAAPPLPTAAGLLEISLAGMAVIVDGLSPFDLFNASAVVGANGAWTMTLGAGLPFGFPNTHLQAAAIDPAAPLGFRLTASVTLEVRNDLETLVRNVVDAASIAADTPSYGPSLAGPGFNLNGLSAAAFFAGTAQDGGAAAFHGIFPNATNAPALPGGAPAPGQSVAFAIEASSAGSSSCPPFSTAERSREYDYVAQEVLGAWKFQGNQRDADVDADVATYVVSTGASAPAYAVIEFKVDDDGGARGGVASCTLTGPQLAALTPALEATSAASGTVVVPAPPSGSGGSQGWYASVAVGSLGTSRFPLVEDGAGPRDAYQMTVHWNDGSSSGPYTVVLRAALDVTLVPAAVVASTPGAALLSAVLTNAGTPAASVALTFDVGAALPLSGTWSRLDIALTQTLFGFNRYEFHDLQIGATPGALTVNLCVPGLLSGSVFLTLERADVYDATYRRAQALTL